MYSTIKAKVVDQTLTITSVGKLASGGENEIRVEVSFDSYWSGYGKTAIFYREEKQVYHVVMVSDACVIPREVLATPGRLYFGILGTSGSSVRTTEVVALNVAQGAITTGVAEPLPDVYRQVLAAEGKNEQAIAVERARLDNLVAGGTGSDAELVDLRVGADGVAYASAGTAVRANISKISSVSSAMNGAFLSSITLDEGCYVPLELQTGKCLNESFQVISVSNGNPNYHVTQSVSVTPGEVLLVSGYTTMSKPLYCVFDADGNALDTLKPDKDTAYVNVAVCVPAAGSYMLVAGHTTLQPAVVVRNFIAAKPWSGKTWVAFGDSITEKNYRAKTNYVDYIVNEMGITALNYGISGSGYAQSEYAWHSRISELANVDFDIITLYGSGNDLSAGKELGDITDTGTTTLCGCVNTTLDTLFSIKPLVKVGIILSQPWASNMPSVESNAMQLYNEKLVEIAKRRGIPVLDLYHTSNLRPDNATHLTEFYLEDGVQDSGVHPNSAGHKRIYPLVREFLRGLI